MHICKRQRVRMLQSDRALKGHVHVPCYRVTSMTTGNQDSIPFLCHLRGPGAIWKTCPEDASEAPAARPRPG